MTRWTAAMLFPAFQSPLPTSSPRSEAGDHRMTAGRHVSVEESEVMPLEGKWELIDGEVIELSLSAAYPSWVGGQIFGHLHNYVESHRAGWAFSANAGFVLFPDRATVRSPNAAFVTFDRLPRLTDH